MTWFSFLKIIFWRFVHVECITTSLALITVYRVLSKEYLTLIYSILLELPQYFAFQEKGWEDLCACFLGPKVPPRISVFILWTWKLCCPKRKFSFIHSKNVQWVPWTLSSWCYCGIPEEINTVVKFCGKRYLSLIWFWNYMIWRSERLY